MRGKEIAKWTIAIVVLMASASSCTRLERPGKPASWLAHIEARHLAITDIEFLPLEIDGGEIAWSPDGERIAYVYPYVVRVINLNGEQLQVISPERGNVDEVAPMGWSADGRYFAFSLQEWREDGKSYRNEIGVVDMETDEFRQVTDSDPDEKPMGIWVLDWAPEGHKIVTSDHYRILDLETMEWEEIAPCEGNIQIAENRVGRFTIWSPDGKLVGRVDGSIVERDDIPKNIHLACLSGEWKRVLVEGIRSDSTTLAPEFSPDGSKIIWMERKRVPGGPIKRRLMVMDATGGTPKQLIADDELGGARFTGAWAWSPDGRQIAAVVGEQKHGIYIFTLGTEP